MKFIQRLALGLGFLLLVSGSTLPTPDFKADQMRYSRVRNAYQEKEAGAKALLTAQQLDYSNFDLLLRAYKAEKELQVFAKKKSEKTYQLVQTYDFCLLSGELGPKRRQGDYQVPEGFYHIDRFNPASNFHLSLGINYPNVSDRILGYKASLGGDIFIHGACVTVGCIPITNAKIKELYILAVQAKNAGQKKIPVLIFPNKMRPAQMEALKKEAPQLMDFWVNLKAGHDLFESSKQLPAFRVTEKGHYVFTGS
mgnify:CR=1 FL=1